MTGWFAILIYLLILGVVVALIYYVVDTLGVPDPLNRIIKVVAVVIACIIVIGMLLQLVGIATFPRLAP